MVTISKATVMANLWETLYDRLSSDVLSVTIGAGTTYTIQTYSSSFPDSQIDDKDAYPILIIDPVEISWTPHTLTKKNANGTFTINIYSTNSEATDLLMDKIVNSIETYRDDFYTLGVYFTDLQSVNSDNVQRGGFKVHLKSCTFSFIFRFTKTFP